MYVNVYEVGRSYGGPEEGGWWFDTGEPVKSQHFTTREAAEIFQELMREKYPRTNRRSSVLGGEDYDVVIEDHPGEAFPKERPHYE